MKIKIGNKIKTYDLSNQEEAQLMFNNMFLYYSSKFPFFINVLITLADIQDVEEKNMFQLAYTYYDFEYERIKIHINYKRIEENDMTTEEIMFLIFHEYLHNYYYHFQRMKQCFAEAPALANMVADYYVNECLYELFPNVKGAKIFDIIGIVDQNYMEQICKQFKHKFKYTFDNKPLEPVMYEELKKIIPHFTISFSDNQSSQENKQQNNNKDNSQEQDGQDNENNQQTKENIDSHEAGMEKEKESMKSLNEQRKKEGKPQISENDMRTLAQNKIENTEKEVKNNSGIGTGDRIIIREKEKIMKKNPFLNALKLKRIINSKLKSNTVKTYKRISRKKDNSQIIFKGKIKEEGRKVVIALDVSGSISDKDLKMFYEMLNGFLDDKKHKTSLDVIYWSDCDIKPEVNFHQNIKDANDLMKLKIHSSGGTNINYLHRFIKEYYGKIKEKIVLINITDGYFYLNDTIPDECLQYYFILTEPNEKDNILNYYQDNRVKAECIKSEI